MCYVIIEGFALALNFMGRFFQLLSSRFFNIFSVSADSNSAGDELYIILTMLFV